MITFFASKFKISVDREGEAKLVLIIPQSDAIHALEIPTEKLLKVTVTVEE